MSTSTATYPQILQCMVWGTKYDQLAVWSQRCFTCLPLWLPSGFWLITIWVFFLAFKRQEVFICHLKALAHGGVPRISLKVHSSEDVFPTLFWLSLVPEMCTFLFLMCCCTRFHSLHFWSCTVAYCKKGTSFWGAACIIIIQLVRLVKVMDNPRCNLMTHCIPSQQQSRDLIFKSYSYRENDPRAWGTIKKLVAWYKFITHRRTIQMRCSAAK